jgi:Ca-activated chloride channel family protein
MFTRRRKGNNQLRCVLLLLALFIYSTSPQLSRAQGGQQQTSPPLRRIRRVRGEQPRTPPSPSAQTTPSQNPSSSDEDEVVRIDTDLATILLTAIDKENRFITTLRREDVRVTEDNVPQELSIFQRETDLPLSLTIVIDTSRSQETTLPDEKIAARTFIDRVVRPDKDQVAVISFTGEAVLQQTLTNDLEKLRGAVERVVIDVPPDNPTCEGNVSIERDPRCFTGVWDAIWVTVNEVLSHTPERTRRAIILLSDGDDTSSMTKRQEAIDFAVKNNTVIYSIGIGDDENYDIDEGALRKVSEKTGGRVFFPPDKAALEAAFAQIQQELRSQYLIAYSPANKRRDGSFRQVKIEIVNPELKKQKLRLLYREGYYARSAPPTAAAPSGEIRRN